MVATRRDYLKGALGLLGGGALYYAATSYEDQAYSTDVPWTVHQATDDDSQLAVNIIYLAGRGREGLTQEELDSIALGTEKAVEEGLPDAEVDVKAFRQEVSENGYRKFTNLDFDPYPPIEPHLQVLRDADNAYDRAKQKGSVSTFIGPYDNLKDAGRAGVTGQPDEDISISEPTPAVYQTSYIKEDYSSFIRDKDVVEYASVHELGHQLGIGHPLGTDVMSGSTLVQVSNALRSETSFGSPSREQWKRVRKTMEPDTAEKEGKLGQKEYGVLT